jgi:2-phospho-L-lactate guanylyltransferase
LNSPAVIVPVKSSRVKSRLSGILPAEQRLAFSRLLLSGVLGVLTEAGLLKSTYVVTSDRATLKLARTLGAFGVAEEGDRGVNSAVVTGVKASGSPDTVLVFPSDLPLLRPSDVTAVLTMKSTGMDVVISPSRGFDGTNALAFSPSSKLALSYDDDSFWNHLASAALNHLRTAVNTRAGLMFDVDSPDDFRVLAESKVDLPSVRFARRRVL